MCGRYSLFVRPEDVEKRFGARFAGEFQPRYNAAPSQSLPVIADARSERIETMEWGFVPPWADDRSDFEFINARAETLGEKPTFREAFAQAEGGDLRVGRCLVPADGFYEWVGSDGGTQPYRVTLADDESFAMAGLWAQWRPPQTQTGLDAFGGGTAETGDGTPETGNGTPDTGSAVVETFTIVTTEPNDLVADLHHRMAVILPQGEERQWLRADREAASDLLGPYPSEKMRAYPVSDAVNDPSNDSPAIVEPLESSGQ